MTKKQAVCIGVGAIVIWAGGGLAVWYKFCTMDVRGQFGDMFGAVTSLFSVLSFGGVLYALSQQASDNDHAVKAETFKSLFEMVNEPTVEAARAFVLTADFNVVSLFGNDKDREKVQLAIKRYDLAGIMCERKYLDADAVVETWGRSILRCYKKTKEYIEERRLRDNDPELWMPFERLAERARKRFGHVTPSTSGTSQTR